MSNIIEINDFHASELDVYARVSEVQLLNKDKPEEGIFIAESPKVIERALDAGYEPVSLLVEKRNLKGETALLLEKLSEKYSTIPFLNLNSAHCFDKMFSIVSINYLIKFVFDYVVSPILTILKSVIFPSFVISFTIISAPQLKIVPSIVRLQT